MKTKSNDCLRFGIWNIGTLNGKAMEIVDMMIRRIINILYLQETRWVREKAKMIENLNFKLWYTRRNKTRNGVGIIVDSSPTNIVEIVRKKA